MSWNAPSDGNGNKGKDPWGNRGNRDGPPDLDDLIKKIQDSISGIFGRKPTGNRRERRWFIHYLDVHRHCCYHDIVVRCDLFYRSAGAWCSDAIRAVY